MCSHSASARPRSALHALVLVHVYAIFFPLWFRFYYSMHISTLSAVFSDSCWYCFTSAWAPRSRHCVYSKQIQIKVEKLICGSVRKLFPFYLSVNFIRPLAHAPSAISTIRRRIKLIGVALARRYELPNIDYRIPKRL